MAEFDLNICIVCKEKARNTRNVNCSRTAYSRNLCIVVLGGIVYPSSGEDMYFTDQICKKCFNLINRIDDMEVKLKKLRDQVKEMYNIPMMVSLPPADTVLSAGADSADSEDPSGVACQQNGDLHITDTSGQMYSIQIVENDPLQETPPKRPEDRRAQTRTVANAVTSRKKGKISTAAVVRPATSRGDRPKNKKRIKKPKPFVPPKRKKDLAPKPVAVTGLTPRSVSADGSSATKTAAKPITVSGSYYLDNWSEMDPVCLLEKVQSPLFVSAAGPSPSRSLRRPVGSAVCKVCHQRLTSSEDLLVHTEERHSDQLISCSHCSFRCLSRPELATHEQRQHGSRPYRCQVCSMNFGSYPTLLRHKLYKHTTEKNAVCESCGRRFKTRGDVIAHRKRTRCPLKAAGTAASEE